MEITFRHKGKLYNQYFAWVPTRVTSGAWVWMTTYYARETKESGWVSMTPFEFLSDCNYE